MRGIECDDPANRTVRCAYAGIGLICAAQAFASARAACPVSARAKATPMRRLMNDRKCFVLWPGVFRASVDRDHFNPSRCSAMITSFPSSPAPSSITFTAAGDGGVPSVGSNGSFGWKPYLTIAQARHRL